MADPVDPKAFLTLVELAIDNMYEVEAIGELLEKKGLLTKQEIIELAKELKRKNPPANPKDPSLARFTEQDNALIEDLMEVILRHGLFSDHAKVLLGRTIQLLEWGKQTTHKLPEANASFILLDPRLPYRQPTTLPLKLSRSCSQASFSYQIRYEAYQ